MTISIVTTLWGKRSLTERFLARLEEELGPRLRKDVELVLVDNASPDDTGALLDRWDDRATVVRLAENRNFGGGNNAGAGAARGDVLILLNNDTLPTAGALDALAAQALDPEVGLVGCRLLYPDGTIQHAGMAWFRTRSGPVRSFHLFRHETGTLPAAQGVRELDVVTGAAVAIRRRLFLELGGFRSEFVNGYEDTDLCLRVRTHGLKVVYRGDVAFVHDEGGTRGRNADERENERHFDAAWQALLDDDAGLIERLFDGCFSPRMGSPVYLGDDPWGSAVSVEGEVTTLGPWAAEARALVAAFEGAGLEPAARDRLDPWVAPRLAQAEWEPLLRAHARRRRPDATVVTVGGGPAHVVRAAALPESLPRGACVWAASRGLADALTRARVDVDCFAPPIPVVPLGPGGGGVLELDRPVSSELVFAQLAGAADVVVCPAGDPFQRRALIAAAAGAAVVAPAGGPAGDVLGDLLAPTVEAALEQVGDREARRAAVYGGDLPLAELLEAAARRSRPQPLAA